MNYYEELGVPRSASSDEIRHAWKVLARLLHPDLHEDAELRSAAELQMRRLGEIVVILTNPARRRRYDSEIETRERPFPPVPLVVASHTGWYAQPVICFAAGAIAASLVWVYISGRPAREPAGFSAYAVVEQKRDVSGRDESLHGVRKSPASAPTARTSDIRLAGRSSVVSGQAKKLVATGRFSGVDMPLPPEPPRKAPSIAPPPELALAVQPPVPLSMSPPSSFTPSRLPGHAAGPSLKGDWIYVKKQSESPEKATGLYPPVYIETLIHQDDAGALVGHYKARYQLFNQALSPEVAFDFHGSVTGDNVTLPWTSGDGANGEIKLARLGHGLLKVSWVTIRAGRVRSLVSGTAVLMRVD